MRLWAVVLALAALPAHADEWAWVTEYDGPSVAADEWARTPADIDVGDVLAVLAHLMGSRTLDGLRRAAADTDADGHVTVADLSAITALVLGSRLTLPVEDACESDAACEWDGGTPLQVHDGECRGGHSPGIPSGHPGTLHVQSTCRRWGDVAD